MSERTISELLANAPDNWGKWGEEDELGAPNYLTPDQVLRGVRSVETGEVLTLGLPIGHEGGDPTSPGRRSADHYMEVDKGHFEADKMDDHEGYAGIEYADDVVFMFLQGTTHFDALGHVWYDDQLYNGFDAATTKGGLERCGIEHIARNGVVGRGVLLDVARFRDVDYVDRGELLTLDELLECAEEQGTAIEKRDILLIRTGWLELFYEDKATFFEGFNEPGITCTDDVVNWFYEMEIPAFATDTIGNEQGVSDQTGTFAPLHGALLRDQGVVFNELAKLDELAASCAEDEKYDFLFVGSALKILGATASPVNPIAIR